MFYTIKNNYLFFASEIKALGKVSKLEIEIPDIYASLETSIGEKTIYKNIFQIKPGCYLEIDRNSKKAIHKYYFLDKNHYLKINKESQLIEKLRWIVSDSIKIRCKTTLKYGVNISGGLDSTIIALLSKPEHLFTYVPENKHK